MTYLECADVEVVADSPETGRSGYLQGRCQCERVIGRLGSSDVGDHSLRGSWLHLTVLRITATKKSPVNRDVAEPPDGLEPSTLLTMEVEWRTLGRLPALDAS